MNNSIVELVDNLLDTDGDVVINGITIKRSVIFKELYPIAYDMLCSDMAEKAEKQG